MQRRNFIRLLGGAAVAWPLAARAQQSDRVRRIGVLMAATADDPDYQARIAAFQQGLQQLGWSDGRNVHIDTRWATTKPDDIRRHAAELAALAPDVILAGTGTATVAPLLQATRTVPIVFAVVIDPVGAGFVDSLARPGGNATGFTVFEYGMSGKWLELLKQIAPAVTRAAVLRDPTIASGIGPVRCRPGRGAIAWGRFECGRRARRGRNRASRHGIRTLLDWRPDRDGECVGDASSRSDHCARCPAPIARRLPLSLTSSPLVASSPMDLISSTNIGRRPATSIASSRARSQPSCRYRRRPSTSLRSTSRRQKPSASPCRPLCSRAPAR